MLLKLAKRNIFRNRRRTYLTVSMMVFGYVLFSFFISLADGGYQNIISQFVNARTGEAQIHRGDYLREPKIYKTIEDYQELIVELEARKEVRFAVPRVRGAALAFLKNKNFGAQIIGMDFNKEIKGTSLLKRVDIVGEIPASSVLLGKQVAKSLKAQVGDEIMLLSSGVDGSIANDLFKVVAIIDKDNSGFDDGYIYMPLASSQEFFSLYGQVHELMLRTTTSVSDLKIDQGLTLSTWEEVEEDFYRAMKADQKGDSIARFVIMLVVALGVLNTVLMSILERMREFGVLKAIGTAPSFLFKLIVVENLLIATMSVLVGAVLALALNYYFFIHGIQLEESFSYGGFEFHEMKASMALSNYTLPAIVIFITSLIVSLLPALKVARLAPMEAMRKC